MKRNVLWTIPMVFLLCSLLGNGKTRAEEASGDINQMQATIKAQAAEIAQLKRELGRLQHNVDQAWANVHKMEKEEAELKKIVAQQEKALARCQGTNR